jgi:hypothetical protein
LRSWIEYIYSDKSNKSKSARTPNPDDLIFSSRAWNWKDNKHPTGLYDSILQEFQKLLKEVGLADRKENGIYHRRKITFHSFRRFVKTTIANKTRNDAYAEWHLGHSDTYYSNKFPELKRIYKEDCQRYLTFLDYDTVENVAKNTEEELKELRKQNDVLKAQMRHIEATKIEESKQNADVLGDLTETVKQLQKEMAEMKKARH